MFVIQHESLVSWMQVEIEGVTQSSSVHIKRCRYLAESGCAGMCINLCKSPTQVTPVLAELEGYSTCLTQVGRLNLWVFRGEMGVEAPACALQSVSSL